MSKHLCALDCKNVSKCKWVLAKKKEPEKYKGLVVKAITYQDCGKEFKSYNVTECPNYKLDERSSLNKVKPPKQRGRKASFWWTEEEKTVVADMYGKFTYAEIAKKLGRTEGGLCRIVKMLRKEGRI